MATGSRTLKLSILADVTDLKAKLGTGTQDVSTFGDKVTDFGKKAGLAFAAAAAAAGAYAVKIGIDGVKAAIADEAAQVRLAGALQAATGATDQQIAAIEKQILKTSLATGVADDELRPAMQRLAVSTGDTAKAQDLLTLALDTAKATGKPLETVTNALAKANEGNTTALGKLGVGLTAAELKTMSFQDAQQKLTDLWGGAAATNAETFQGRMDRLKVALDEAKETIGTALMPIIETMVGYFTEYVVPIIEKVSDAFQNKDSGLVTGFQNVINTVKNILMPVFEGLVKGFGYIKDAIGENLDEFKTFVGYIADYVAPVVGKVLGAALQATGKIASGVIDIIGNVLGAINNLIDKAIDGINFLIRAYNAVPFLGNVNEIGKGGAAGYSGNPNLMSSSSSSTGSFTGSSTGSSSSSGGSGGSSGSTSASSSSSGGYVDPAKLVSDLMKVNDQASSLTAKVAAGTISDAAAIKQLAAIESKFASLTGQADTVLGNAFYTGGSFRKGEEATMVAYNITVNGAIDSEGTARTITETVNDSYYRGTGGATALVGNFSRL